MKTLLSIVKGCNNFKEDGRTKLMIKEEVVGYLSLELEDIIRRDYENEFEITSLTIKISLDYDELSEFFNSFFSCFRRD